MHLFIDIGNTRIKWAAAHLNEASSLPVQWLQTNSVGHDQIHKLSSQLLVFFETEKPAKIVFSNVAGDNIAQEIEFALLLIFPELLMQQFQSQRQCANLINLYETPNKLGSDRFASAIAARAYFPQENIIVATCGTATTVDAVNAQGEFIGGMILPGLQTMAISLAKNTAQLPYIEAENTIQTAFGLNTNAAIMSGCIHAQVGAIWGALDQLAAQSMTKPILIMTGGAAPYLMENVIRKNHYACHHIENLVLAGLYVVAKYEESAIQS